MRNCNDAVFFLLSFQKNFFSQTFMPSDRIKKKNQRETVCLNCWFKIPLNFHLLNALNYFLTRKKKTPGSKKTM